MKNAVAEFLENLKTDGLLAPENAILVAVSGGVDSVAMAHLFQKSGQKFAIAHCNFQLRGADSDGDEAFVRGLAGQFDVPFFCEKFATAEFAAVQKLSIQMAARTLRYDWFEKIRAENGFKFIATAHQKDDSRETAMLNFFRGTGLRGLRGILPVRGKIIRPILHLTKKELKTAAENLFPGIVWREDRSNSTDDYDRNFLRHQVLPVIEKLNPGFFQNTLDANMKRARQVELFLENYTDFLRHEHVKIIGNQTVVDVETLLDLPGSHWFLLGEILRPFGFREAQTMPIISATVGERGRLFLSKSHIMTVDGFRLFIEPLNLERFFCEISQFGDEVDVGDGIFRGKLGPDFGELVPISDALDRTFFDKKDIVFPLKLRHWQPGDRFKPQGMDGKSKKLQDFFTNHKLARPEKHHVWLLENGDREIIWVVGMRRSDLPIGAADCCFEFKKGRWAPEGLARKLAQQSIENE